MWNRHNVHKMFINIYRNLKTRNWFRYETFIHLFEFKGFRHEERETQSFYADCFYIVSSQLNQRAAPVAHKFVWPLPDLNLDSLSFGGRNSTHWLFSNLKILSTHFRAWRHLHPLVAFSIWGFYFDICERHILPAPASTPALKLHLTNPCTKRKILILTKPKGKMYKTKSLRNYITLVLQSYFSRTLRSIPFDFCWDVFLLYHFAAFPSCCCYSNS